MDLYVLKQVILVACLDKLPSLLVSRKPLQIVDLGVLQPGKVFAGRFRNRNLRQDFRWVTQAEIVRPETGQEAVDAERFFVKKRCTLQSHALIEVLVEILVKAIDLDAQLLQQTKCLLAVMMGSFQRLGSSVADQQPFAGLELIALRVATEIVVIVENQNLRL